MLVWDIFRSKSAWFLTCTSKLLKGKGRRSIRRFSSSDGTRVSRGGNFTKLRRTEEDTRRFQVLKRIDEEDESSRASLAFALYDLLDEEAVDEKDEEAGIQILTPPSHLSLGHFHLPDTLTEASVMDMLTFFRESSKTGATADKKNDTLHPFYFSKLLRESREVMKVQPPIVRLDLETTNSKAASVHIVGDLHGSLHDLCCIFDRFGFPGDENLFIFNGDMVDRGAHSVEVLSVLLGLKIARPDVVHLNRGNHEDWAMSKSYGFENEIMTKFGPHCARDILSLSYDMFASLPYAVVLETYETYVCHGGPVSGNVMDIDELSNMIVGQRIETVMNDDEASKVAQDILWSDPDFDVRGTRSNESRGGVGIFYGSDVVKRFLRHNGLRNLVRSHECVLDGVERVKWLSDDVELNMYTVFSCTNYPNGEGFNRAGVLTFRDGRLDPEIYTFEEREEEEEEEEEEEARASRAFSSNSSLRNHISLHLHALREAFDNVATPEGEGDEGNNEARTRKTSRRVTNEQWCDVMSSVLGLDVDFERLRPHLSDPVMKVRVDTKTGEQTIAATEEIAYDRFLASYGGGERRTGGDDGGDAKMTDDGGGGDTSIENIFRYQVHLTKIFKQLDLDGDGEISLAEFTRGIRALNKRLIGSASGGRNRNAPMTRLICDDDTKKIESLFGKMDTDRSGSIDLHEFSILSAPASFGEW